MMKKNISGKSKSFLIDVAIAAVVVVGVVIHSLVVVTKRRHSDSLQYFSLAQIESICRRQFQCGYGDLILWHLSKTLPL